MNSQLLRAQLFKSLHERDQAFVIPNPWDAGSAKLLASMGFEALATTSAGLAFALGRTDGDVGLQHTLDNITAIVNATDLPVAADLENCFADSPEGCAETILKAAAAGIVGGSVEDASGNPDAPIYDFELSVARVKAAVAAARSLPFPFMLTARAENFLHGRMDFADTLRRLEAYADAGADVLYAPCLRSREEIIAVVGAVAPRPVNVVMGLSGVKLSVAELSACGVKRISVGSSMARAALGEFCRAAQEISQQGTFTYAAQAPTTTELNKIFRK
jgi:2-methylisocitrate lyase-like PEP mutase family enzyme